MAAIHPGRLGFWFGPIRDRPQGLAIIAWTGWTLIVLAGLQLLLGLLGGAPDLPTVVLLAGAGVFLLTRHGPLSAGVALATGAVAVLLTVWSLYSTQLLFQTAPGLTAWLASLIPVLIFALALCALRAALALSGLPAPAPGSGDEGIG